jgi:hypothetical protein
VTPRRCSLVPAAGLVLGLIAAPFGAPAQTPAPDSGFVPNRVAHRLGVEVALPRGWHVEETSGPDAHGSESLTFQPLSETGESIVMRVDAAAHRTLQKYVRDAGLPPALATGSESKAIRICGGTQPAWLVEFHPAPAGSSGAHASGFAVFAVGKKKAAAVAYLRPPSLAEMPGIRRAFTNFCVQ